MVLTSVSSSADIRLGDCLDILKTIPDGTVDVIIDDLPYGDVINSGNEDAEWDKQIPMDELWKQFYRVSKPSAAIVLFAQGMFTAQLMMSNPKGWKYNLVWSKIRSSGFLNANRQPLRGHEDICVFYRKQPTYNPQFSICSDAERTHSRGNLDKPIKNTCYGTRHEMATPITNRKFPTSILTFPKPPPSEVVHPTQKPVELLRWLIRTYTNKGETVLDATMGSGSTGVAAMWEDRNFIGVEKTERYFDIAHQRIDVAAKSRDRDRTIPKQESFL